MPSSWSTGSQSLIWRTVPLLAFVCALPFAGGGLGPSGAATSPSLAHGDTVPVFDTIPPPRTIVRVDTIRAGDSIRIDTVFAPPPAGLDSLTGDPRGGDGVLGELVGDTIDPIRLRGFTVDILRAPMALEAVPFAVSVLEEELRTRGRSDGSIEEALQGLPGVQIHNRFNDAVGERVSIRGYGARSEFGVRGVRILVDGIPATLPDGQSTLEHLDLGSLGRVEALRGPGSALYGNAAGGVLHFETRPPAPTGLRQELRVVSGEYGYERRQSTTSGQAGSVGYLMNLSRHDFGGYRANPLAATGAGLPAGARTRFGSSRRDHLVGRLFVPVAGGEARLTANILDLSAENPGALSLEQLEAGDRRAFPFNVQQRAGRDALQSQLGVQWGGPVRSRELEIVAYGVGRDEENRTIGTWSELGRVAGGIRAVLRSESEGDEGRLWWAMGVDTDIQADDRVNWRNLEGAKGERVVDQAETVRSGAVFLQAMLPINEILDVLTGLRYDRIRFSVRDRLSDSPITGSSGARTFDSASPSFGFHAGFHPAFALYLNLSTAFETPTTGELGNRPDRSNGFDATLEPQVGITTEVGGRGVIAPALAWEAVFFHTTLHHELIPFEAPDRPGERFFRNSTRSSREGWEVALQFTPDPAISARLVWSRNDARYRSYRVGGVDYAGRRVPGLAPARTEGILRVGPGSWFAEVRGEATAAIPGDDANDPGAESPAYRLLDLRAGANEVSLLGLQLSPFVGITNVFDRVYNTSVVVNSIGGRYFEPGPGRALYFGANVAVEF